MGERCVSKVEAGLQAVCKCIQLNILVVHHQQIKTEVAILPDCLVVW
jgi:hypothetical protein